MQFWINSSVLTRTRDFIRRHLQGALQWREKLVLKEEAFHLILAGAVGMIGGLVNLFFYEAVHLIQPGNIVEVAERLQD
ncbi:MAG TPA: hypothetical protein VGY98_09005, partial [Verrucomicrobiae bacterium]|nr:hypothetical protein [Verrucomicrobiae bacterium]